MKLTPLSHILCCAALPGGGLAACQGRVLHTRECTQTSSYTEFSDSFTTKVRIGEKFNNDFKSAYAISYKATRYLALPCLMADLYRGNDALSTIHLLSGIIPFALALSGEDNVHLGNLVIACNIISLGHYSLQNNREWGWYAAGAAVFAYIMTPQMGPKVLYPLGLALMEYCAYRLFHIHYDSPPS